MIFLDTECNANYNKSNTGSALLKMFAKFHFCTMKCHKISNFIYTKTSLHKNKENES